MFNLLSNSIRIKLKNKQNVIAMVVFMISNCILISVSTINILESSHLIIQLQ